MKWLCGRVMIETGPLSYLIRLNSGKVVQHYIGHLKNGGNLYENRDKLKLEKQN